jgi:hypothetical protein
MASKLDRPAMQVRRLCSAYLPQVERATIYSMPELHQYCAPMAEGVEEHRAVNNAVIGDKQVTSEASLGYSLS